MAGPQRFSKVLPGCLAGQDSVTECSGPHCPVIVDLQAKAQGHSHTVLCSLASMPPLATSLLRDPQLIWLDGTLLPVGIRLMHVLRLKTLRLGQGIF